MNRKQRQERFRLEVAVLRQRFEEIEIGPGEEYLIIHNFPLLQRFNYTRAPILLFIPRLFPILPPVSFALPEWLSMDNRPLGNSYNGWVYFQLPRVTWCPTVDFSSGYTLINILNQIQEFLSGLKR